MLLSSKFARSKLYSHVLADTIELLVAIAVEIVVAISSLSQELDVVFILYLSNKQRV